MVKYWEEIGKKLVLTQIKSIKDKINLIQIKWIIPIQSKSNESNQIKSKCIKIKVSSFASFSRNLWAFPTHLIGSVWGFSCNFMDTRHIQWNWSGVTWIMHFYSWFWQFTCIRAVFWTFPSVCLAKTMGLPLDAISEA